MAGRELSENLYQTATECGFDDCGILSFSDLDEYRRRLAERMEKLPQSHAFYKNFEGFSKLEALYPWGKAIVVCTIWLGKYKYPPELQGRYAKAFMLSPETVPDSQEHKDKMRFESWLDSQGIRWEGGEKYGPRRNLPLRQAAVAAGLGIFRKNNFFYAEKGSYYELEGYVIDRECTRMRSSNLRPCPPQCNLCQKACKTHALCAPYTMDPLLCISFLTTFGQGNLPPQIDSAQLENWICGCDACQDACPFNRHDWSVGSDFPGLNGLVEALDPANILKATDEFLCERIVPKTASHIPCSQVGTLRKMAERALQYAGKSD